MDIQENLKNFYNEEAKTYYQTRNKQWSDGPLFLEYFETWKKNNPGTTCKILELACGGGRFIQFLQKNCSLDFAYTGVDISQELLKYAKKDTPQGRFICESMEEFVADETSEAFDFVVITAGFQHLPDEETRKTFLRDCYKILKYEGKILMTNWAYSDRFKNKYRNSVQKSKAKYLLSFGKISARDVLVPRKGKQEIFQRYYHLFSMEELKNLGEYANFVIEKLCFIDAKGATCSLEKDANNSFFVGRKSIYAN